MGVEDEILDYLQCGYSPKEVIELGYTKSTVYKVYKKFKAAWHPVTKPVWKIKDIKIFPEKGRYLPGERITISFNFENTSDKDLYLYRVGIQPEWCAQEGIWYAQEVRELIKPHKKQRFSLYLEIPEDLPLGEYEVRFGVEGQYLPVDTYQPQVGTLWADIPLILHIKYPKKLKIFVSHSTKNIHLVRELEKQLDNYGIEAIIAEDRPEPGVNLWKKFQSKINESNIFLALLTEEAIKSKWVIKEVNYALEINKPTILLKEKSVKIDSSIEWIEFSKNDRPEAILAKIIEALEKVEDSAKELIPEHVGVLGVAILSFLLGLFLGTSKS